MDKRIMASAFVVFVLAITVLAAEAAQPSEVRLPEATPTVRAVPTATPTPEPTPTMVVLPTRVPLPTPTPEPVSRLNLNTVWVDDLLRIGMTEDEARRVIDYRCAPSTGEPYKGRVDGCGPNPQGIVTIGSLVESGAISEERAIDLRLTEVTEHTWQ